MTPLLSTSQEAGASVVVRTSRVRSDQCPLLPAPVSQVLSESPFVVPLAPQWLQCSAGKTD